MYASSVQYISGDVVKEICKIQKDFIWRGKRPKIKHSTLIGNFENGGLKDIDIESKLKALKLSWIKRLLDSNFHPWKTLAAKLLEPVGGTKIFHSNLSMSRECHKGFTSLPTFYKQLIEFWELTSIGICDEPSFILNQSVWNNKHITKSLYDTTLPDKGINYIKDIFNTITCDFKLWNEVKSEFRLPESMIFLIKKVDYEYYANTGDNDTCIVFKEQLMSIGTIRTKEFYDLLISKIFKQPSSQKTIARKLNVEISNWKEIYTLPRKITHDSYSRIFQYKILNNILYLNKHLHQFKIVSTPLCSLCSSVNETVFHLFGECLLTIKLWKIVQKWSTTVGLVLPDLNAKDSVLGFLTTKGTLNLENHVLLIFKMFLYRNKQNSNTVSFTHFRIYLKQIYDIEHTIARRNGSLARHYSKWDPSLLR